MTRLQLLLLFALPLGLAPRLHAQDLHVYMAAPTERVWPDADRHLGYTVLAT